MTGIEVLREDENTVAVAETVEIVVRTEIEAEIEIESGEVGIDLQNATDLRSVIEVETAVRSVPKKKKKEKKRGQVT